MKGDKRKKLKVEATWWGRVEREAEPTAGESGGGVSDHVSRSAVEVCGFLTGVLLSITSKKNK
jgi:hypothetical protein